ncbi:MAG TPA: carboxypeptidase regulatory-like domain-containing protein [Methanomicrobia archaeon]|nr:carboxypeptidase regulatory-like domain-containing protein [Methanomicrobia archaeon]
MQRTFTAPATTALLVAALFGLLLLPVQALGTPFVIYGQVFDGTRPVDGVTVTVTNLATGSSVSPAVTDNGGWYLVDLAHLEPNEAHAAGDTIQITATTGAGKMETTVVARAEESPQLVRLVLDAEDGSGGGKVPGFEAVMMLLALLAGTFLWKRKR